MNAMENADSSDCNSDHLMKCEDQNENGELVKLSEESLNRQPEEVFDIICKLGEGSYGSVFKALHKESGQVLAIKQVPIDTDLQEIIKEISIMQQCDSPHVVKYYGSYFKDSDLWIVMEYCGAGSVLDIMKLRKKTLTETEIGAVVLATLYGLEYLHLRRKIHRDIKAGNILLNSQGHAKLADFGVAGQLSDTMAKRNTVIGTPFWMAPEVIQEIGYDCVADIWSLGITALEMAEGKAPYGDIHPMRAIFMIPTKPPPSFRSPDKWQPDFIDFVTRCLVKNPEERATATELLQHPFIVMAQPASVLRPIIEEARVLRERQLANKQLNKQISKNSSGPVNSSNNSEYRNNQLNNSRHSQQSVAEDSDSNTMVRYRSEELTLKRSNDDGTLVPGALNNNSTLKNSIHDDVGSVATDLGTMVINSDSEEDEDSTMKRHDTAPGESRKYRPLFLDHFDKKEREKKAQSEAKKSDSSPVTPTTPTVSNIYTDTARPTVTSTTHPVPSISTSDGIDVADRHVKVTPPLPPPPYSEAHTLGQQYGTLVYSSPNASVNHSKQTKDMTPQQKKIFESQLARELGELRTGDGEQLLPSPSSPPPPIPPVRQNVNNGPVHMNKFQRSFVDGDFDFLRGLSRDDLGLRMSMLDSEMEQEIDELRQRYQAKRQPILDAMDHKRKRQHNF